MPLLHRRDAVLLSLGASLVYFFSLLLHTVPSFNGDSNQIDLPSVPPVVPHTFSVDPLALDIGYADSLPETTVLAHAPGHTLFKNLYMANCTFFAVSSYPEKFPQRRMITSTGLIALNNPENIRLREPSDNEFQIISPETAIARWGGNLSNKERHRVWSIEGISFIVNETGQFLHHYYHLIAELLLGTWAFFYGAFNPASHLTDASHSFTGNNRYPSFNPPPVNYQPPPLSRMILLNAKHPEWRDRPGVNQYFFRAAFPSLHIEDTDDWNDRCLTTFIDPHHPNAPGNAWHLPMALLVDRSAANRGKSCTRVQRMAAEAWDYMRNMGGIDPFGIWWDHIRYSIYRFAGVEKQSRVLPVSQDRKDLSDLQTLLPPPPEKIVITYINRQAIGRRLNSENHDGLVAAIKELVARKLAEGKNWVFNDVKPENLPKAKQVELASETTIMMGVHGNGLSHLVLMEPNRYSAVIEIFVPGGFSHDYEWTANSLGIRHYSIWNDTYFTAPNEPKVDYPPGFQGKNIPVHGPTVAQLIEDRLEGRLHY